MNYKGREVGQFKVELSRVMERPSTMVLLPSPPPTKGEGRYFFAILFVIFLCFFVMCCCDFSCFFLCVILFCWCAGNGF